MKLSRKKYTDIKQKNSEFLVGNIGVNVILKKENYANSFLSGSDLFDLFPRNKTL